MHQGTVHALVLDGHLAGSDYPHDGFLAASSRATDLAQQDVVPLGGRDVFLKTLPDIETARGMFASGRSHLDEDLALPGPLLRGGRRPGCQSA